MVLNEYVFLQAISLLWPWDFSQTIKAYYNLRKTVN